MSNRSGGPNTRGYLEHILTERIALGPALSGRRDWGGHEGSWRLRRLVLPLILRYRRTNASKSAAAPAKIPFFAKQIQANGRPANGWQPRARQGAPVRENTFFAKRTPDNSYDGPASCFRW